MRQHHVHAVTHLTPTRCGYLCLPPTVLAFVLLYVTVMCIFSRHRYADLAASGRMTPGAADAITAAIADSMRSSSTGVNVTAKSLSPSASNRSPHGMASHNGVARAKAASSRSTVSPKHVRGSSAPRAVLANDASFMFRSRVGGGVVCAACWSQAHAWFLLT